MYIVVDFDGTVVTHDFPNVGKDIGSIPVLKRLVAEGHKLILFTMRSKFEKKSKNVLPVSSVKHIEDTLLPAVQWFKDNDIPLYGIQINPTQWTWTSSPKAYGQLIIDDAAMGCPLMMNLELSDRPFVDWKAAEEMLEKSGVLTNKSK